MAQRSSIERHPERERIIEAMANGVPGVDIARQYGISESAISRFKLSRKNLLTHLLDEDGNDPTAIIGRLVDLSDSARITRKLADASGSAAVRARAISAELSVLDRLSKLSIDDTATARLAAAVGPMVRVVGQLSEKFPTEVFTALDKYTELEELRDALKSRARRNHEQES